MAGVDRMRWLCLVVFTACAPVDKPDLSTPYACGSNTCDPGQICLTEEAGSQCGVNPDAGIPPYGIISQRCVDLPAACDGLPTCECVLGQSLYCSASGRDVTYGCI